MTNVTCKNLMDNHALENEIIDYFPHILES